MVQKQLKTIGVSIRLRPRMNTPLERCLRYMRFLELDINNEISELIRLKFLALTFKHEKDEERGRYAAYEAIGQLEGLIQYIREVYQIKPSAPLAEPEPTPTAPTPSSTVPGTGHPYIPYFWTID